MRSQSAGTVLCPRVNAEKLMPQRSVWWFWWSARKFDHSHMELEDLRKERPRQERIVSSLYTTGTLMASREGLRCALNPRDADQRSLVPMPCAARSRGMGGNASFCGKVAARMVAVIYVKANARQTGPCTDPSSELPCSNPLRVCSHSGCECGRPARKPLPSSRWALPTG